MVALAHLEKFVGDRFSIFGEDGAIVLDEAKKLASDEGFIMSGEVERLLGEHAQELFNLMRTDAGYLRISGNVAPLHQS